VRSTGIGCFFDDEMHALLGIDDYSWQSLYHYRRWRRGRSLALHIAAVRVSTLKRGETLKRYYRHLDGSNALSTFHPVGSDTSRASATPSSAIASCESRIEAPPRREATVLVPSVGDGTGPSPLGVFDKDVLRAADC
jgi:hypothetical protein